MEEEYVVEAIRGWRYNLNEKRKEYFIKWLNYDEEENTWEPQSNLNCSDILDEYIEGLRGKQRRFHNTSYPDRLTGFQRNAKFIACVGADGPHSSDEEGSTKEDKQAYYCLITFEDSPYAEEVTMKEFFRHQPTEAFKFCERRILVQQPVPQDSTAAQVPKKRFKYTKPRRNK